MKDADKWKRIDEIWHHPDLKIMSKKRHDALAQELVCIGEIGGAADFLKMCGVIRKKRRRGEYDNDIT